MGTRVFDAFVVLGYIAMFVGGVACYVGEELSKRRRRQRRVG